MFNDNDIATGMAIQSNSSMASTSRLSQFPFLSIVIPAYNVKRYVTTCLRSVFTQASGRDDIEVVIVLDGPTDGTDDDVFLTVREFKNIDIHIIKQENNGLSHARNVGVNQARGKYIAFLDSDDFWLPEYLSTVLYGLTHFLPDILEYDAIRITESGEPSYRIGSTSARGNHWARIEADSLAYHFSCYAWSRIYKRTLLAKYPFPIGHRFEDTAILPWIYWEARNVVGINQPLIAYRRHPQSILESPTTSDINDLASYARRATDMFISISDDYWREIALRIHQQCCSRMERIPIGQWHKFIYLLRNSIHEIPLRRQLVRYIQACHPWTYTALLRIKRRTIDPLYDALGKLTYRISRTMQ